MEKRQQLHPLRLGCQIHSSQQSRLRHPRVGERKAYEKHLENISYQISVLDSARIDGRIEGREEGKNKAREEITERMRKAGFDEETIQRIIRK